jgi:hypothetical protein
VALSNENATPGNATIEDLQTWRAIFGVVAMAELVIFRGMVQYNSQSSSAAGSQVSEQALVCLATIFAATLAMLRVRIQ